MKKIFSTSLIVLGIGLFFASPVFANGLVIEFEETPLFNEANFLPGESITRWVEVTNNSGETQRIAAEAINVDNSDGLGYALVLEITEGLQSRYINDLSKFFNAGEVYLSDLENGSSATYNFSISFYSGTNNTFQGKSLGFDILVGFQGEGGGLPPGSGGGGGGFLPRGLTITNEATEEIEQTTVTISWTTNYASTSQVIYAIEGETYSFDLTQPNYGYLHASPDPEDSTKVTAHSVIITGLTPGTTYYYRCVSHASLAVSTEHSFTTLDVIGEQEEPAEEFEEVRPLENLDQEAVRGRTSTEAEQGVGGQEEELAFAEASAGKEEVVEGEETGGPNWLFAAIGDLFFRLENLWWLLLLLIIIIIILYWLSRKKKRKEE